MATGRGDERGDSTRLLTLWRGRGDGIGGGGRWDLCPQFPSSDRRLALRRDEGGEGDHDDRAAFRIWMIVLAYLFYGLTLAVFCFHSGAGPFDQYGQSSELS